MLGGEVLEGQVSIFELVKKDEKSFDFIILVYKSLGSYKSYKPKEKIRLVKGMKIYYIGYEYSGFGYYDCIIKEVREDSLVIYDYLISYLPEAYDFDEIDKKRDIVYNHFYENYATSKNNTYSIYS